MFPEIMSFFKLNWVTKINKTLVSQSSHFTHSISKVYLHNILSDVGHITMKVKGFVTFFSACLEDQSEELIMFSED